jgi:benzoyl-CoA reductase subunit D
MHTIGIDIGSGAVKSVLFRHDGGAATWVGRRSERIRRRDPLDLARQGYEELLAEAKLSPAEVAYVATTGEGENVKFATGHFYSMTTHARGGVHLVPEARAVIDIGALNGRAIRVDERGKVLAYKMTSQCASGSGQFLENIARYLGVSVEEIGPLSRQAHNPEKVSSICAVLAETDVINMVSRGIPTSDILKGIHLSMASRIAKLLKATGVSEGTVLLTGGLALDSGLLASFEEELAAQKLGAVRAMNHADSIFAGAIGAALWGAFRHGKLAEIERRVAVDGGVGRTPASPPGS